MKNRTLVFIFLFVSAILLKASFIMRNIIVDRLSPETDLSVQDTTKPALGYPELSTNIEITGLSNVWDVGFLPDDTVLFTERAGTLSKISNGKKQVIAAIPNVAARGEGGLMGLAIDPDFANNRYVYACYNTRNDIRISRWKLNESSTALSDQKEIIVGMPSIPIGRHSGCRPEFGADKNLWVGTGDAATGTNPQDPKSLGGKVLRVDREGKGVPGNLQSPFDNRIYSYGHRNIQGMAMFDKPIGDSYGFSIEHGSSRDDEVNALIKGNFGWDPSPVYNEAVDMTDLRKFPDAIPAVWSSGRSTIAVGGGVIIKGSKWQLYENSLWMGILKDKHIRMLVFDEQAKNVTDERKLFEGQFGRIRSVKTGPFQDIYITTDNGSGKDAIIRISPK